MAKSFDKSSTNLTIRVKIAFIVTILCFSMITVRLWYLQILKGQYFRERSENNRIRTVYVPPPRGLIVARGGEVMVKLKLAEALIGKQIVVLPQGANGVGFQTTNMNQMLSSLGLLTAATDPVKALAPQGSYSQGNYSQGAAPQSMR